MVSTPAGFRWMACSAKEYGAVGVKRHLVYSDGLSTACGASASHSEIWRGNSTKKPCPTCVQIGRREGFIP